MSDQGFRTCLANRQPILRLTHKGLEVRPAPESFSPTHPNLTLMQVINMKNALRTLALVLMVSLPLTVITDTADAQRRGAPKTKNNQPETMVCPGCFGTGETIIRGKLKTCPACKGTGVVPATPPKKPH
jgi:hypothetical protein